MDEKPTNFLWTVLKWKQWRWNVPLDVKRQRAKASARWNGPLLDVCSPIFMLAAFGVPNATILERIMIFGGGLLWLVWGIYAWRWGRQP